VEDILNKCPSFSCLLPANVSRIAERNEQLLLARELFQSHDAFKEKPHEEYMSYVDQYKSQLEHAANAIELTRKNPKFMMQHMQGVWAKRL
jgi:hypothetical protein